MVYEADQNISSTISNKLFKVKGTFLIPKENFNKPSQNPIQLQNLPHLKDLEMTNVKVEHFKVSVGAGNPEAFCQLHFRSGSNEGNNSKHTIWLESIWQ